MAGRVAELPKRLDKTAGGDVETFDLTGESAQRFRRAIKGMYIGDQPRKTGGK